MTAHAEVDERLNREVGRLVDTFLDAPAANKVSFKRLLANKPQAFCTASIRLLADGPRVSSGIRYLAHLLSDELVSRLADTESLRLEEALAAARTAVGAGVKLDRDLENALRKALKEKPSFSGAAKILRIMDLLAVGSSPDRWNLCQADLMAYPDKKIRSRATLLIGRANKNLTWLGNLFTDGDPRIQANAVEALWHIPGDEAKPMLNVAAKSRNNRVMANALLGLYRCGDTSAIPRMLAMSQHSDPLFQISAIWTIGQTVDTRFIPFLMQRFKESEGKTRFAITRVLAQLRRLEKAAAESGSFDIRILEAATTVDGRRRIAFTVCASRQDSMDDLHAGHIAIFESDALIEAYDFKTPIKPELALFGFVMPRFVDSTDPEGHAYAEALRRCLAIKRTADSWRIDQYSIERGDLKLPSLKEDSNLPYDDALITVDLKKRRGFILDAQRIQQALTTTITRERAATDAGQALTRQLDAIRQLSGKRNVILLLNAAAPGALEGANPEHLLEQLRAAGVTLHCLNTSKEPWLELRELCKTIEGSTFTDTTLEELPRVLETIYLRSLKRFEVAYDRPAGAPQGPVRIKITSSQGAGAIDFQLPPAVAL